VGENHGIAIERIARVHSGVGSECSLVRRGGKGERMVKEKRESDVIKHFARKGGRRRGGGELLYHSDAVLSCSIHVWTDERPKHR